jgi:hypothetical protein
MRKRKAQKRRHYCQIPVQITLSQSKFSSVLFDISALGAKIKKHESGELSGTVKLNFSDNKLAASIQWRNAHFFGVLFHTALSQRQLRSLIDGQKSSTPLEKATA